MPHLVNISDLLELARICRNQAEAIGCKYSIACELREMAKEYERRAKKLKPPKSKSSSV
jgi:hypothetical protein